MCIALRDFGGKRFISNVFIIIIIINNITLLIPRIPMGFVRAYWENQVDNDTYGKWQKHI